ncbi:unnamed protein product [Gongylonema pulchrum]|uniref:Membralin n=1 Tax=Gongylonema pulchrum TaxID=637853 RepID=A0A183E8U8_9BILA|nr:unnamed protein product [Gongylonema pulchrum]
MRRFFVEVLETGRNFYYRTLRKFRNEENEDLDSEERAALSQSAERIFAPESTDDESSAIRLSRRSSVLVIFQLLAPFVVILQLIFYCFLSLSKLMEDEATDVTASL